MGEPPDAVRHDGRFLTRRTGFRRSGHLTVRFVESQAGTCTCCGPRFDRRISNAFPLAYQTPAPTPSSQPIVFSIIHLAGAQAATLVYQLERKLFDTGHAATVLEQASDELAAVIKQAGLLCLCVGNAPAVCDLRIDTDAQSIDDIYALLKQQHLIH